jgi:hypothetical protein
MTQESLVPQLQALTEQVRNLEKEVEELRTENEELINDPPPFAKCPHCAQNEEDLAQAEDTIKRIIGIAIGADGRCRFCSFINIHLSTCPAYISP